MLRSRSRGVVLLSVMFLAILIAMYVAASSILTKGQIGALQQSSTSRLAEAAARSGLEYAQARLEEDPRWMGDDNMVTVKDSALTVREDHGNVIGLITNTDGSHAQFRIRFNYQDGPNGGDALPDPDPSMRIDTRHISVNNLARTGKSNFPLGTGKDGAYIGVNTSYPIPGRAAAIVCEGRVFPELNGADENRINPTAQGRPTAKVIEAFYRVSGVHGDSLFEDGVAMSRRDLTLQLTSTGKDITLGSNSPSAPVNLRSQGNIKTKYYGKDPSVSGRPSLTATGEANAYLFKENGSKKNPVGYFLTGSSPTVARQEEDKDSSFYKVTWNQATKMSPTAVSCDAGVYVYWEEDSSVHYYQLNFEDYKNAIKNNPTLKGEVLGDDALKARGLSFTPKNADTDKFRFELTSDIDVTTIGKGKNAVKDFAIIPRSGAKEDLAPQVTSGLLDQTTTIMNGGITETTTLWPGLDAALKSDDDNALRSYFNTQVFVEPFPLAAPTATQQEQITNFFNSIAPSGSITSDDGTHISWDVNNLPTMDPANARILVGLLYDGEDLHIELPSGYEVKDTGLFKPDDGKWEARDDALARLARGGAGKGIGQLSGSSDQLGAGDFEVVLGKEGAGGAAGTGSRLKSDGSILIAANVKGNGGSIVAGGDIQLVGVGIDVKADPNAGPANISLYSQHDIRVSTLSSQKGKSYAYTGLNLQGVLYAWNNINILVGETTGDGAEDAQAAHIQGAMIAYGGDPSKKNLNGQYRGAIDVAAANINLQFDPSYLLGMQGDDAFTISLAPLSLSYRP